MSIDYVDSSPIELPSTGVGDESNHVTGKLLDARRRFNERSTTNQDWNYIDAQIQNEVTTSELLINAQKFVAKLPKWIDTPTIDIFEEDGEVVFEWYENSDRVVNAVVTDDGTIFYSCLLGPGVRRAESDEIDRGVPQGLISAIKRISSTQ